ncbi:MAG: NAD(P)/FAD-dependent oxidoreductase [Pseudomonadota bacterium]
MKKYPVIIIGAGPAGIGVAALLARCAIPALILERGRIGESFLQWPKETKFISPSFTGNFFGAVDLNAITPDSSPAFGLQAEHPTGEEYARYLNDVAQVHELRIDEGVDVLAVERSPEGGFHIDTSEGELLCRVLIWAGGEFQYKKAIPNTVRVGRAYGDMPKGHHVILGGAESGMEAAFNLVDQGSSVTVLDPAQPWAERVSDSSYGLSPFTFGRVRALQASGRAQFIAEAAQEIGPRHVRTQNQVFELDHPAVDATGFDIAQGLAGDLFDCTRGYPHLTDRDESTLHKNVYLVGPNVQHEQAIFCFIYKYRQRFAVVVSEVLSRWGQQSPVIAEYAERGFLLDDLSCCDGECVC